MRRRGDPAGLPWAEALHGPRKAWQQLLWQLWAPVAHGGFCHACPDLSPHSSPQCSGERPPFRGSSGAPSSCQLCGNVAFGACRTEGLQHQDMSPAPDLAGARGLMCSGKLVLVESQHLLPLPSKAARFHLCQPGTTPQRSLPHPLSEGRACAQWLCCSAGDMGLSSV